MTGGAGAGADDPPPTGTGLVSGTSSGRKANGTDAGVANPAAPPGNAGSELRLGSAGWANAAGGDGVVGSAPDSSRAADDGPKPTAGPGSAAWSAPRKSYDDSPGGLAAVAGDGTPPAPASEAGAERSSASAGGAKPEVGGT